MGDPLFRTTIRSVLDAVEDASPVEAVEAATRELSAGLGASSASFLIADLSGRALVRMPSFRGAVDGAPADEAAAAAGRGSQRDAQEVTESLPLGDGPATEALRTQAVVVVPPGEGGNATATPSWTVLAPVTERGEALGLLELVVPAEPTSEALADIARTAHVLAFVVVAGRRHTDVYEWASRSVPYSLSAEIQRRLLPAGYTCETGSFTLSGWLEPSASVGGDTYDYSLDRDVLHLSVTDAMGHGVDSSLTATLCVGNLRNARRYGLSLQEQAAAANEGLCAHVPSVPADSFCTGLVGRLDLTTGVLELVNAGHVAPYLLHDGTVVPVELDADLPFGFFPDTVYRTTSLELEPGDRLVLVTDGMLERNAADLDMSTAIAATAHQHPREATRALTDLVLEATGHALADDATLLMLDWHPTNGRDRATRAGAAV